MKNEIEFKKAFIETSVDTHFIVSWNPLVWFGKWYLGEPITKKQMKEKMLRGLNNGK